MQPVEMGHIVTALLQRTRDISDEMHEEVLESFANIGFRMTMNSLRQELQADLLAAATWQSDVDLARTRLGVMACTTMVDEMIKVGTDWAETRNKPTRQQVEEPIG